MIFVHLFKSVITYNHALYEMRTHSHNMLHLYIYIYHRRTYRLNARNDLWYRLADIVSNTCNGKFNSLRPIDAYMRQ